MPEHDLRGGSEKRRVGPFEVIRPLGHGGMASAHLARAPDGSLVVLKKALRRDGELEDHIVDEARVGSRLSHPSLVETRGLIADDDGAPVLVVGYIPGVPLDVLIRSGKVRTPVILRIARQIASALHTIHTATDERGQPLSMVHRDVSPSNIILGLDGDARLIDLGIVRYRGKRASETAQGFLRGKVKYLAPELFNSSRYSPQSDLWALGVVMFELALGRSALRGGRAESIARIVAGRLLELDHGEALDPRLESALRLLLEPDVERRIADAATAERMLARLEEGYGDTRTLACLSLPVVPLDEAALSAVRTPPPFRAPRFFFRGHEFHAHASHAREVVAPEPPAVDAFALPPTTLLPVVEGEPASQGGDVAAEAAHFEDSSETTIDLPHLRARDARRRDRRDAGLATVVRSWIVDPGADPREQIQRYIDVLRGFEALPFVT